MRIKLLKLIESLLLTIVILLAPLKTVIMSVLVLVLIDTLTGILAARKQGIPIESNKLKRMVSKLLLYYSATIVGFVASTYLVDNMIPVEKMITTLIGVVETKSVLENLDIISGGDFFKSLLNKLDKSNDN